ncbi:hypothetical protein HPB48_000817 [Haemaphysalis longicornis]|uniref:Uncharacterized protein n=1 Tax=Haemaphysalis longicornis TaxID=44386 RepID=A0A9J6GLZ2_HAELO|nr:hypothetical protein HPB48_000817 [Haemaphysalis longicornis]
MAPWASSLLLLGGCCCCWRPVASSGGGTSSSATVGLLATSRHNGSASPTKVGATSASWSFPITSSFLPSSTVHFPTTQSPSSYLKNHATSYSPSAAEYTTNKNMYGTHRPSSANLVYSGPSSNQAAYAAAYYATSSTTTTTTRRPFAYNLPYSPIDYYFENKKGGSKTGSADFKHASPSSSRPSSNAYYTSNEYEDDEEDADRVRYSTRNDAIKGDYDSTEASPATYVKTKYGYTSRNPLLLTSESSKVSSLLNHENLKAGNQGKDGVDKGYATASSDHYDYKGYIAADYADDFGYPDVDHNDLPYLHRRKHHSGKGPLALLLGLLPLGLLMAALVPSVINLPVAAVGAVGAAGRRRREAAYRNPILDTIARFGVNSLEDPRCMQRIFCEVTAEGKAPGSLPVQKVFYTLSTLVNDAWAERLGLKTLFQAVKKGKCDVFRCRKNAKPTKQGRHTGSGKAKHKVANESAKKASKE